MKTISEKDANFYDSLGEDQEKWDDGGLGRDPQYTEKSGLKRESKTTTFRLPVTMIADLKKIAVKEGLPYQSLVKSVLHKYIQAHKESA